MLFLAQQLSVFHLSFYGHLPTAKYMLLAVIPSMIVFTIMKPILDTTNLSCPNTTTEETSNDANPLLYSGRSRIMGKRDRTSRIP
jgi:hypothetical protein